MNYFTNTTGAPITFTMITSNNLGSDSNTRIVSSSSGDNVVTTADTWATSFQNFSGNTSSDPRIGHVFWGPGAPTPVSNINFVDGDDNPFWVYSITLAPGQTKAILNFATGQGTKAAANAQAAALDLLSPNATQCLSATELGQIVNFATSTDLSIIQRTARRPFRSSRPARSRRSAPGCSDCSQPLSASWRWRVERSLSITLDPVKAERQKIEAAREALRSVRSGMSLGLGTGSTAKEFVTLLGEVLARGDLRDIRCTCTSKQTEDQARPLGISLFALAEISPLDLAVDGADEIDAQLRLIKGRGGALLREKIVEQQAKRFIVIADESKIVERLGVGVLPVEVTPFARDVLEKRFAAMGLTPVLRLRDGQPRITDEGHLILDVRVPGQSDIADVVADIRKLAGVVETGFFPVEATEALIATGEGVRRMTRGA